MSVVFPVGVPVQNMLSMGWFVFFVYTVSLMRQSVELEPPDLWVVQILSVAVGWVSADKLMAVLYALKLTYPMPGVEFVTRGEVFWSPEVEDALKRLIAQGLVAESGGAYRLTRRGNKLAEKVLPRSSWTLPYTDVVFYMSWDVRQLTQYVAGVLA